MNNSSWMAERLPTRQQRSGIRKETPNEASYFDDPHSRSLRDDGVRPQRHDPCDGTVTAITDATISIKGADGKIQTVAFTPTTKFLSGITAIAAKDIKVGDHTVIHATKKGNQLVAAEVKLGAMKMKGMTGAMSGMSMDHSASATPH